MADTDAMAALRRYVQAPGGATSSAPVALDLPDIGDDDEVEVVDDEDEDEDEDDEGEPGDDEEDDEEEEEPGTPIFTRARRVVGTIIPQTLVQRVARAPTPTGLLGAVAVLLILTFLLVPANTGGATRFELLWRALTGGVTLPSGAKAEAQQEVQSVAQDVATVEQTVAAGWQTFWDVAG